MRECAVSPRCGLQGPLHTQLCATRSPPSPRSFGVHQAATQCATQRTRAHRAVARYVGMRADFCCVLLRSIALYCVLLRSIASQRGDACRLLLRSIALYCVLLRRNVGMRADFYCVLLRSIASQRGDACRLLLGPILRADFYWGPGAAGDLTLALSNDHLAVESGGELWRLATCT